MSKFERWVRKMKIYKYRSNKDPFLLHLLTSGHFWFASWNKQNDPMEGLFSYFTNEMPNWKVDEFVTEKRKLSISCFSASPFIIPMWSHYSNEHRGVCIEVELTDNPRELIKVLPIEYRKKIPFMNSTGRKHDALRVLTSKLNCWKIEEEVRAFIPDSPCEQKIGKITAVYLGIRTSKETESIIAEAIEDTPIKKLRFCANQSKLILDK